MARRTHLFIGGLLVLAAGGCDGEKRVDLGQMKLVFDACWNVGGTDDGEASCGAALRRRTDDRVPVCVAFHSSLGGQVAPMWRDVDAGRFVPAGPPRELKLDPGGEEVIVKVFFLAGGADPETACTVEAFTVETRCEVAAGCLLASDGARVAVGSGAPALEWGGEDRPCQFECGDPAFCGVAGAWAQETCNGVDDDCDGEVDEGELNVCGECGPDPEEVCNGEDDDCDGQTDEGAPGDGEPCDTGEPGVCASGIGDCTAGVFTCERQVEASAEECDGLDNDCDGETDNGLQGPNGEELHQPCIAGVGECERAGESVCTEDGLGVECNAEPGEPAERDRCGNDVDDDCDGRVDEWEGGEEESRECVVGIGECQRRGQWDCDEETGEHTVCSVEPGEAKAEVCGNGLDEDCDGTPDQDCACDPTMEDPDDPGETVPETQACYTGNPGTRDEGPCHAGVQTCQADGTWGADCADEVVPAAESCNGVDDDCDGAPDDGLERPPANRQDGVCAGAQQVCGGVVGWEEPDYTALDAYEAEESTCDGLDNDCDGGADNGLQASPADWQDGVCSGATKVCMGADDWAEPDYSQIANYQIAETECDGLDNDCVGGPDNGLQAPLAEKQDGVCAGTVQVCMGAAGWKEPVYAGLADYEEPETSCDGLDNDCDGEPDNGLDPLAADNQEGVCQDAVQVCAGQPGWVEPDYSEIVGYRVGEGRPPRGEEEPEDDPRVQADEEDNDCDGQTDEWFGTLGFDRGGAKKATIRATPADPTLRLAGTSFTIEAWIWPAGFAMVEAHAIVSRRASATRMGYMFGVLGLSPTADRNQHPRELVFLVDEWPQVVGATGEYVLGEHAPVPVDWAWHHVAVVFELDPPQDGPHRVSLFLDGVLVGRDPAFPRAPPDANAFADTLIGADDVYHPDYVFSGMIADVRISDTARYGLAPDCTDLGDTCIQPLEPCLLPDDDTIAYWPLSEGAGCEVHDLTNGEPGSRPPDTTAFDGYVGEDVEDEDCSDRWTPSVGLPCSER